MPDPQTDPQQQGDPTTPTTPKPGAGITFARPTPPQQQDTPDTPDPQKKDDSPLSGLAKMFSGGDGMEDMLIVGMLMLFFFSLSGGGGKGSGMIQSLLKMFTGGQDPAADNGATPTEPTRTVDSAKDTSAKSTREDEVKGGLYAMASLINLDPNKPLPTTDLGKRDRVKVADDLFRSNGAIAFYDSSDGQYKTLQHNSADELNKLIANDKQSRIRIDYGVGGEHKYQYLQQTLAADREDSKTGFAAASWKEIDAQGVALDKDGKVLQPGGKANVILGFPGYTGNFDASAISSKEPQNVSLQAMAGKALNPQAVEAAAFTDAALEKVGRNNVGAIITGAHSMGISNARTSEATAQLEGVQTKLIDLEPALDGAQSKILNDALHDKNSALHQQLVSQLGALGIPEDKITNFRLDSNADTTSVRTEFKGSDGQMHTTAIANVASGEGLQQGFMNYMLHRGDPNGTNAMQGATKDYVDMTSMGLQDPSMEGHKLVNLVAALKDANVTMAEVTAAPTAQASLKTAQTQQPNVPQHG